MSPKNGAAQRLSSPLLTLTAILQITFFASVALFISTFQGKGSLEPGNTLPQIALVLIFLSPIFLVMVYLCRFVRWWKHRESVAISN
jgi:uncharacterized protein VirK/YbjX